MPNSSGSDRSVSVSCSVVPDSLRPHELTAAHQAPLSMGFSRQGFWNGLPFPSPGDLPHAGIESGSPALQADSLPTELQGKPKNTGMGNLSLLKLIFLTQESNWGLLHCRRILYQLSYQGSPFYIYIYTYFITHAYTYIHTMPFFFFHFIVLHLH